MSQCASKYKRRRSFAMCKIVLLSDKKKQAAGCCFARLMPLDCTRLIQCSSKKRKAKRWPSGRGSHTFGLLHNGPPVEALGCTPNTSSNRGSEPAVLAARIFVLIAHLSFSRRLELQTRPLTSSTFAHGEFALIEKREVFVHQARAQSQKTTLFCPLCRLSFFCAA